MKGKGEEVGGRREEGGGRMEERRGGRGGGGRGGGQGKGGDLRKQFRGLEMRKQARTRLRTGQWHANVQSFPETKERIPRTRYANQTHIAAKCTSAEKRRDISHEDTIRVGKADT